MKTKTRKAFKIESRAKALFLTLLLVFSLALCGCNTNNRDFREIENDDNPIAELSLYTFDGESEKVFGIPVLGHAFIQLKNISDTDISIYDYPLAPNEQLTFGGWGQSESFGIWFNIEAHYMSIGRYKGIASITQKINSEAIERINEFMPTADKWTPTDNCSQLALNVWNLCNSKNKIENSKGLMTPAKLKTEVELFTSFKLNKAIENFGKIAYKKDGNLVYCEMVK